MFRGREYYGKSINSFNTLLSLGYRRPYIYRNIAIIYNTKEYEIIDSSNLKIPTISENEQKYQELWSTFFNTISIKERTNSRLQMQYMPKKYWKDLVELNN